MTKIITVNMLRAKHACDDQLDEFERRFPNGVTFASEDDAVQQCEAVAETFDWGWAAGNLLMEPLLIEYMNTKASLLAEYMKARAPLRSKYEKALKPLWTEYEKARLPLWTEYEKGRATLFARLFWKQ